MHTGCTASRALKREPMKHEMRREQQTIEQQLLRALGVAFAFPEKQYEPKTQTHLSSTHSDTVALNQEL